MTSTTDRSIPPRPWSDEEWAAEGMRPSRRRWESANPYQRRCLAIALRELRRQKSAATRAERFAKQKDGEA